MCLPDSIVKVYIYIKVEFSKSLMKCILSLLMSDSSCLWHIRNLLQRPKIDFFMHGFFLIGKQNLL